MPLDPCPLLPPSHPARRPVKEFGCALCQAWHTSLEPLYAEHLHRQAKHHYRERPPEPWEVFRRLVEEEGVPCDG
jgi:hypothetical protein